MKYAIGEPGHAPRMFLTSESIERVERQVKDGEVFVEVVDDLPRAVLISADGSAVEAMDVQPNDDIKIRSRRTAMLAASDWTQLPDAPLSEAQRAAWTDYRQALRDLPESQSGIPFADVEWPQEPY